MSSLKRKMQRQQQRMLEHKFQPKKVNPAVKGEPLPDARPVSEPTFTKESAEMISKEAYYAGLRKGMQTAFLFAIDCLEKTMQETKGVGQKTSTALRNQFHQELHTKELFDNFMAEEPKGEVYIVNKEDQEVIETVKAVQDVVYAENSLLTNKDILSILSFSETPHDSINTMEDIIRKIKTTYLEGVKA